MVTERNYLDWLLDEFCPAGYEDLLLYLNDHPFTSEYADDQNRIEDAIDLRGEFLDNVDDGGFVSVLEVLIALLRRMGFILDLEYSVSELMLEVFQNSGLEWYSDNHTEKLPTWTDRCDDILDRILNHKYEKDGTGGLFPIDHKNLGSQRVPLWKQMNNYITDSVIY